MPNQPDQGTHDERLQGQAATLGDLFVELAHTFRTQAVAGDSRDISALGVLSCDALESTDPLTVLQAQTHLLRAATRLLFQYGDELGRGED